MSASSCPSAPDACLCALVVIEPTFYHDVLPLDRLELAWAAGFFDGEGSTYQHSDVSRPGYLRLEMKVPQKGAQGVPEVLIRFQRAVGGTGRFGGPNADLCYWWEPRGRVEAFATIALIWNDLGDVKRRQANEAIRGLLRHYEQATFESRVGRHVATVNALLLDAPTFTRSKQSELAWAAGFIDAEGCFGLARAAKRVRGGDWFRVRASASQHGLPDVPAEVLLRLRSSLGFGRIERHGDPDDFRWVVEGPEMVDLTLRVLEPYLSSLKRDDANRALDAFRAQTRTKGDATYCLRGHPYSYVIVRGDRVRKYCLACARLLDRRARAAQGIAPRQFKNLERRYTE